MLRKLLLMAVVTASLAGSQVPQRRLVSLVVANGTVITVDGNRRVLSRGSVAIDGRDIVAVDTAEAIAAGFRGRETIDAAGAVVMPGLINTHTHAPMVLFRGLADDLALMEWLQKYIFPAEAKTVSPEFVRAGTRLAALEMIESGTTTYADMYYFEEEIARVTKAAGLRGVLGRDDHPVSRRRREDSRRKPRQDGAVRQGVRRRRADYPGRRAARDVLRTTPTRSRRPARSPIACTFRSSSISPRRRTR